MKLLLILLVLVWHSRRSECYPKPYPGWKHSRYIIDNRRNVLFNKHYPIIYGKATSTRSRLVKSSNGTVIKQRPLRSDSKDLSAEASIGRTYYQKFKENALPGRRWSKISKDFDNGAFGYKMNDRVTRKYNSRGNPDPQNLIRSKDYQEFPEPEETNLKSAALTCIPRRNENALASSASVSVVETTPKLRSREDIGQSTSGLDESKRRKKNLETAAAFSWRFSDHKSEEGNLIDELSPSTEKHVYETRIETVSYHQEVIHNRSKTEAMKKTNWHQESATEESKKHIATINDKTGESYEHVERNFEENEKNYEEPERNYEEEEKNYMEEQKISPNVRSNTKFGYVVEGKNFRKYRVEERTADGFIVGEYGVVSHDDGTLRGVRYTADGATNPQLIYQALISFLSL